MERVKLVFTDDNKIITTFVAQKCVLDVFWEVAKTIFKVNLRTDISQASTVIDFSESSGCQNTCN